MFYVEFNRLKENRTCKNVMWLSVSILNIFLSLKKMLNIFHSANSSPCHSHPNTTCKTLVHIDLHSLSLILLAH